MPRRAPSTQAEQLELFGPARVRPTWGGLPKDVRKTAVRLLVEMLRDHWGRQQQRTQVEKEVSSE